ncbi:hypothetical protein [Serratia quinivorans]|uniref:hypothetical protein n=1 Tax=Serratia quinivorans TaxID=137545 RepID=UPI002E7960BD|nr:hypothetical protein [Serratia quinivorans]
MYQTLWMGGAMATAVWWGAMLGFTELPGVLCWLQGAGYLALSVALINAGRKSQLGGAQSLALSMLVATLVLCGLVGLLVADTTTRLPFGQ